MNEKEKIAMLEECMELDEGTLKLSEHLDSYDEWDSVAKLSFIVFMSEKFHKTISGDVIKGLVTVEDAINLME